MKSANIATLVAVIGLSIPGVSAAAGLEVTPLTQTIAAAAERPVVTLPAPPAQASRARRHAVLPALYASLGAMQAWDARSTSAALKAGAREANPVAAPFVKNARSLVGLKAATTASTIFFAERMWRKNRVGAVVLMAAINGATAAISMNNMRNARVAAGR